jgi:hypothetical protein
MPEEKKIKQSQEWVLEVLTLKLRTKLPSSALFSFSASLFHSSSQIFNPAQEGRR